MDIREFEQGSSELPLNVEKAIKILSELDASLTDRQVTDLLYSQGIEYPDASDIAIFLPIAFCRLLLPNFDWKDQYYEFKAPNETGQLKTFNNTRPYLEVFKTVKQFFATKPDSKVILKIAGRSSEFKAINELLLKGWKLEDIKLTPMNIVW